MSFGRESEGIDTRTVWHPYHAVMDTSGYAATLWQVVTVAILIGVAAWLAFLVYRAMDHPRLALTPTAEGPRARPEDVAKYVASMPFLILLWWTFFFAVFLLNENHLNIVQLVVFPSALVLSIRALAFLSRPTAYELGKVMPVALVAFVILDGAMRSPDEIEEILIELDVVEVDIWIFVALIIADFVFTAAWYWGWIRWGQPRWAAFRTARSGEHVAHDDGGVAVLADADRADGRS